ncbi:MAG: DMT family transporter [bacterium]|nr:DMT family transporter [bacterium]
MKYIARAKAALLPAILAVSTAAIFVRSADVPPMAAAFWRGGFCAIIFLFALFAPSVRQGLRAMGLKKVAQIAGVTVIIATHQICFITSLSYTLIAASTFLTCTQPIFTAFLGYIFLKERVSLRSLLAIIGAVVGMGAITFGGGSSDAALTGNLWHLRLRCSRQSLSCSRASFGKPLRWSPSCWSCTSADRCSSYCLRSLQAIH